MKHYNIPVFISHFGCPNSCVFCNQKKITGIETDVTIDELEDIIEDYLKTLPKESRKEVAFFGGTFTGISINLQRDYLSVVKRYIDEGKIDGIRMSTRPDYISHEILLMLKEYGVTTIELGVQSLDTKVLELSGRGYRPEKVYEASSMIKEAGIALGIQLMPGLPGSTDEKDFISAKKVVGIGPDMVRIYPTLVINGTQMEKMYYEGSFVPMTLKEAVDRVVPIYALFEKAGINIIRVGLQPSEDIREDGVIVDGPFHPSFRELVEGEIYFRFLSQKRDENGKLYVKANEKNISKIVGNRGINKKNLGNNFKISIDNNLSLKEISINGNLITREEILNGVI
ncbi:radical SAM protein [uncultured Ilyobacter sp.]|uniref:elongator complex protein 3 n=1 Tax=uncultured Ilyobacter sp. TaxID=544433 RepID=UPI002AA5E4FC|nr:radical SAM protein [uncultured Ilyobacter sp.]